ncbi:MAG: FAD-dependent oxidoreductase [Burkholderiales bacterium]|nr:FAD-dependent oxidoreductase [Burkholderiales bacterium]
MSAAPRPDPVPRCAVVGAGMAGLACAQALAAAGWAVDVFDKSRGPAGRMSTRRGDGAPQPWQCDHGAQYFTARDPAFRAQVQHWQHAGVAALWPARFARHDGQGFEPLHTPLERFVGVPRMTTPVAHGWQQLGAAQAPHGPVQLRLQATVQALAPGAAGWSIACAEPGLQSAPYRAVLLALPAPQAVPLLRPVAPAGAALAASARMRGCWAVMVRCPAPVPLPCDGAFINTGLLRWVARDSSKPGRGGPETWLLHATAHWSEAHLEDAAEDVTAALLRAFAALGGPDPACVQATAHRWRYADTEAPLTAGCWWDADAGLGLCGDWLHGGKVEGAWLSGRALARCVLGTPPA